MSSSPHPARAASPSRARLARLVAPTCALATLLLTGPALHGEASAARMPAAAPPQAHANVHEAIVRLLERPDSFPRASDWAPLGPEALPELLGLASNPQAPEPQRTRAVAAIAVVAGLEALPLVTPLLGDRSEQVRATAAQTLGRLGGAEARKLLEERLPLEESLLVREAIQMGLSYLEP